MPRLTANAGRSRPAMFYASDALVRATLVAALVVAALAVSLSFASAQDRAAAREACKPDYQKLCQGTTPGGGRIKKCLADNYASLSDACKQVVGATK